MITTISNADTILDLRVYPVYDLVIARDAKGTYAEFDSLIGLVTSTVAPTTWSEVGGSASIKPFFNAQAIVVTQTREGHLQVEGLLAALRRTRDVQGLGGRAASAPRSAWSQKPPAYAPPSASYAPVTSAPTSVRAASPLPASRLVRVYE